MKSNLDIGAGSPEAVSRNRRAFDAWAPVYDAQANPLLALEGRYLKPLLPAMAGRRVLDVGCGSGRWLRYVAGHKPASLAGIDPSSEMLRAAADKETSAELLVASCHEMPFACESFDLILSSFVLSYVDDLSRCAAELHRVAQPGCDLFLTDMHPETMRTLGWKRSFEVGSRTVELHAHCLALQEIIAEFAQTGWTLRAALGPEFGDPERALFESSGRMHDYHAAQGHPAIYLLQFHRAVGAETSASGQASISELPESVVLRNAAWAMGPAESQAACSFVTRSRIVSVTDERLRIPIAKEPGEVDIDLSGFLLLPGLINAHDHLEFALFPRLGTRLYQNAAEWADDIHKSFTGVIALHRRIPMRTRLLWGGLRNLLCGATTVCHHNPLSLELKSDGFPVHVVRRYGWGHSLRFSSDLKAEHDATPVNVPFLVHSCEGIDAVSRYELTELDELGVLNSRTIMIHGLALDGRGAELLRSRGVSLIVCPSSNQFLFGELPSAEVLSTLDAIALGSDSPLTACGDLLDEIRFAAQHCGLSSRRVYSMVAELPAAMLRLPHYTASLRVSALCDAIAVRDRGLQPDETLCSLSSSDIELVLRHGRVFLASEKIFHRLPPPARHGLEPLSIAGTIRWLRAPISEMLRETEAVLGKDQVKLGGKQVQAVDPNSEHVRATASKELIHAL
jgi:ubiquinone/menaquinone biosynthesis C-methylase UbiE